MKGKEKAYVLGITGNTGSGKSSVCGMLKELGAQVLDADAMAKELQEPGQPGYRAILGALGQTFCWRMAGWTAKSWHGRFFPMKIPLKN